MHVLIIKNIKNEGPGTIEDFLKEKGAEYDILEIFDCKAEIPDLRKYSHLVIMGGPMAVYEIDDHSYLNFETAMIRVFIKSNKPVLGICLGAQMIAYALGAKVYKGNVEELGWNKVEITEEGIKDPVISNIAVESGHQAEVFQWHGDTFDLPDKAVRISSSDDYKNQAFRYKNNVYALQFHIEVKPDLIEEWFGNKSNINLEEMLKQTEKIYPDYSRRAADFFEKFFLV
jgi:GMP synthase-like glutamine amidotransferase